MKSLSLSSINPLNGSTLVGKFQLSTMAVVVRSSSTLPRPNSARFSRRADRFLRETPVSRRLESLPLKVKRLITSFACTQLETNEALLGRKSIQLHFDHKRIPQISTADQDTMLMKSAPIAVLLTNALVLATPFEALAETCQVQQPMDQMPVFLLVAIIGATVGGLLARQRKGELKRLNEQLRQINAALRRQAKIESYAPNLSYAPVGNRVVEDNEVIVDPRKHKLISHLKNGKNFLRNQDPEKAYVEFETALELARALEDPIEEKKAARGLGASLQRQGKFREAVKYHSMVLAISEREGEDCGNTEAYGAIADCYTEIGDLERAGVYYDQYIARLQND